MVSFQMSSSCLQDEEVIRVKCFKVNIFENSYTLCLWACPVSVTAGLSKKLIDSFAIRSNHMRLCSNDLPSVQHVESMHL